MTATFHDTAKPAAKPARSEAETVSLILYRIVIAVTLEVLAVQTWGLVALTVTALAMVPLMFAFLITIARP